MDLQRSFSSASSGMGVADHCKDTFFEFQRNKTHRYVVFKINENRKEVIVEKTGGIAESFDDFMASLPENDCRYAIFNFDYVTKEKNQENKIFFVHWAPSMCCFSTKMLYASSKDLFRRLLVGVCYEIEATDPSELDIKVLLERAH